MKCSYVCMCTKSGCLYVMRKKDNSAGEIQWKEMWPNNLGEKQKKPGLMFEGGSLPCSSHYPV